MGKSYPPNQTTSRKILNQVLLAGFSLPGRPLPSSLVVPGARVKRRRWRSPAQGSRGERFPPLPAPHPRPSPDVRSPPPALVVFPQTHIGVRNYDLLPRSGSREGRGLLLDGGDYKGSEIH